MLRDGGCLAFFQAAKTPILVAVMGPATAE